MADDIVTTALTARQYNAIAALMSEPNVRKACEVAGIPERTVYKWLKDRAFVEEYRAARRIAVQAAIGRLQQVSGAAVAVLVNIMADSHKPAPARIAAASKVLDLAIKAVELEDLEARLQALEATYAEKH
jgi:hypothetical protein